MGKLGLLQFMGSQRVKHDLATEQQMKQEVTCPRSHGQGMAVRNSVRVRGQ